MVLQNQAFKFPKKLKNYMDHLSGPSQGAVRASGIAPVIAPDWAAIAAAYCAGSESVAKICIQFGIQSRALYKKAKAEGWPLRQSVTGHKPRKKKSPKKKSPKKKTQKQKIIQQPIINPDVKADLKPEQKTIKKTRKNFRRLSVASRRAKMLGRMYELLDQKLRFIEERQDMAEEMNASERERDARALTALVRLFEKMTEMDEQASAATNRGGNVNLKQGKRPS